MGASEDAHDGRQRWSSASKRGCPGPLPAVMKRALTETGGGVFELRHYRPGMKLVAGGTCLRPVITEAVESRCW